jgi:hypothetical protein
VVLVGQIGRLGNRFDAEELAEKERQMQIDEERIYVAKPKVDPD